MYGYYCLSDTADQVAIKKLLRSLKQVNSSLAELRLHDKDIDQMKTSHWEMVLDNCPMLIRAQCKADLFWCLDYLATYGYIHDNTLLPLM